MLEPVALLGQISLQFPVPEHYWVGFSGGLDSTVLLHALARIREQLPAPLSAIHIDHGLQAGSAAWALHCQEVCRRLEIPLIQRVVDAAPRPGESPEAAAREARYSAIADAIGRGAMLLTAHHRDDQAETLLLQLMRGAGVAGLAAMPALRVWRAGWHARPLLGLRRAAIRAWAVEQRLSWIEDPSNTESSADRNYLRHHVMPPLGARWPAAVESIARSAAHCADAAALIDAQAGEDLECAIRGDGARISIGILRGLPRARAHNLVRRWLRERRLAPLPSRRLEDAVEQLCTARPDADVRISWAGAQLRRYRDQAWLLPPGLAGAVAPTLDWTGDAVSLGTGLGRVRRRLADGGIDPGLWEQGRVQIGGRAKGMRCRPAGRAGSRPFKKIAQEYGIPPWLRDLVPVLLIDGRVAAIADCCVCEPFAVAPGGQGWVVEWIRD